MAVAFPMPKLGLTMEQGQIVEWLVADGDSVEAGAPVLLIETDKTETEVEAPAAGTLQQVASVGDVLDCGALVGWLLGPGEERQAVAVPTPLPAAVSNTAGAPTTGPASSTSASAPDANGRLLSSPNARRVARARGVNLQAMRGSGPGGRIVSEDVEAFLASPPPASTPPPRPAVTTSATPATVAARQLADLLGVDLSGVSASSPDGRINREDVAAHVRRLLAGAAGAGRTEPVLAPPGQTPSEIVPLTGIRGTIAARMSASLRDMAQLTLTMDADMTSVAADRKARLAAAEEGARVPGFTDYVVAAVARALRRHPIVNSQIVEGGIALLPSIHVGVAVAADRGLLVPVVRDTDRLGLDALAVETFRLAQAARSGKLKLEDLEGGTFSVSALGMFGVDAFTPVINPPNAAILGVGRLRDDVTLDDAGRVGVVKRMTLSLTWDHRVLDGAPAAEFCRSIVGLLANPADLA